MSVLQKCVFRVCIRVSPKHLFLSSFTRGNDSGELSAPMRAGRVPKWSRRALATLSEMVGTHMSIRTGTVSESRFLLLVGVIGGASPDGIPGAGHPPLSHNFLTIAAVSRMSTLLITCDLGRSLAST